MSTPPIPDAVSTGSPPEEEEEEDEEGEGEEEEDDEKEEKTSEEPLEKVKPTNATELESSEEPCNIYTSTEGEKIKFRKNDLDLLIVHENIEKLSENVKADGEKSRKGSSENEEEENQPPALPPRPPPRPRQPCTCTLESEEGEIQETNESRVPRSCWANGLRKYVFLCTACGSLSVLLGALFLIVYFMLKSYTSSLNHFETIPTYVPSGMLIATGFLIICLACRKNRNSFLMKLCGLCSLCCAVLCVSVTVTTTVIHMNRLQTLRECLYTLKTQSCTCYSVLMDNDRISDEGIKFVFNSTPDCEVIHGALYSCLRAIFGLSVIGILVCIFSCMLVYQLLSHEKKKMYWAQLEMRCRYLYRQQRNPHYYSCCDECRYPPHPHELFPWDLMGNRFWSTSRIGNLYTPNPEDRGNHNRLRSGWNWRRLPWTRSGTNSNEPTRTNLGSPDSQYGFSSTPTVDGTPYTVLDPRTSGGIAPCHPGIPSSADLTEGGFYSWGPPPPYASNRNSANNSPARRSLGDILHQVSPIRRNDNVSPARGLHHVHRHHIHHNRQCSSSSRQMPNTSQNPSDGLQKTTSLRATPITNAIQQQQAGMDPLWNNSLSSVHRFQKVIQNKTNYENMCEPENVLPGTGFNTLPSLKKRNQPRVSDIFKDETSTAYFFSSAENLGCSTSNIKMQNHSENLPPRVFLKGNQPNTSGYNSPANYSFKSQNDLNAGRGSPAASENLEGVAAGSRGLRQPDRNTSLVRKLFVNCSPSKQKPRNAQGYAGENSMHPPVQTPRKKIGKKLETRDVEVEPGNENVITFHYRVGIPRSPDVQNFNRLVDKPSYGKPGQEGSGNESVAKDKISDSEMSDSKKVLKSTKYIAKDMDLLQKHGSLIKEFNKNLDFQKKYRNNRMENMKNGGDDSANQGEIKLNFSKNYPSDLRPSPGVCHITLDGRPSFRSGESNPNEDYLTGNFKSTENESDVYFGDISNSSCYMSLQNDGLESLMYEDTIEEGVNLPKLTSNGHPILSKQNLKMMESEILGYGEMIPRYETHSESKQLTDNYSRHQDVHQQNCRHRGTKSCNVEGKSEELEPSKQQHEALRKTPRHLINSNVHFKDSPDSKGKYFNHGLQDHYRQQESINSNDEQSSGSLTADSGISTGRGFRTTCFENIYHDTGLKGPPEPARGVEERSDGYGEKFPSFTSKISNLDFSHPLFQKPKVLPRGNRYKDLEPRQKKKFDLEESESGIEGEVDCQNKRKKSFAPKGKPFDVNEEVSNKLLNTCNLTLTRDSDHFMENDQTGDLSANQDVQQEETFQTSLRKSPKPLPRTSLPGKTPGDSATGEQHPVGKGPRMQDKEKLVHFIAPDAQYQDNFKGDAKSKTPAKAQNLVKTKPIVPARPLNLQIDPKNGGKIENLNVRMRPGNEGGCPVPRRRHNILEDSEGKENIQIGSHSVNV